MVGNDFVGNKNFFPYRKKMNKSGKNDGEDRCPPRYADLKSASHHDVAKIVMNIFYGRNHLMITSSATRRHYIKFANTFP